MIDMSQAERNKDVIRSWFALINDDSATSLWHEDERVRSVMSENVQWTTKGATPLSGTHDGLEGLSETFLPLLANGDGRGSGTQGLDRTFNRTISADQMLAMEDGRIVVLARAEGCGNNGLPYRNEYCFLIGVEDDRIVSLVEYLDTALVEAVIFDKILVPSEELP